MTKKSLDLSGRINPLLIEILDVIDSVAKKLSIPFFIVGATARDIIFELLHNIQIHRATLDLDLGIYVATWDLYQTLIDSLIKTDKFRKSSIIHRIIYIQNGYPVDIVPFGDISGEKGVITWPDQQQMSIIAFNEAFRDCYLVRTAANPDKQILVASPVGLVLMKLISWEESSCRSEKDAKDLNLIFTNYYILFENTVRIYEIPEILDMAEFDLQRAGTILLGIDVAAFIEKSEIKSQILSIIESELKTEGYSRLAVNMKRVTIFKESEYDAKIQSIKDFKTGLNFHS